MMPSEGYRSTHVVYVCVLLTVVSFFTISHAPSRVQGDSGDTQPLSVTSIFVNMPNFQYWMTDYNGPNAEYIRHNGDTTYARLSIFRDVSVIESELCRRVGTCNIVPVEFTKSGTTVSHRVVFDMDAIYELWQRFCVVLSRSGLYSPDARGARKFFTDILLDDSPFAWKTLTPMVDFTSAANLSTFYTLAVKLWEPISGDYEITYPDLKVFFTSDIDGGGRIMGPLFPERLKEVFPGRKFKRCFEWCAGPGFIGYTLLKAGICDELVLADVNPKSVAFSRYTARFNGLEKTVTVYQSDNLNSIPSTEKFDLVVGNPPWFFYRSGIAASLSLRGDDPEYALHTAFLLRIADYLNPNGALLLTEGAPSSKHVHYGESGVRNVRDSFFGWESVKFDRPEAPIDVMKALMQRGGLAFHSVRWNTLILAVKPPSP